MAKGRIKSKLLQRKETESSDGEDLVESLLVTLIIDLFEEIKGLWDAIHKSEATKKEVALQFQSLIAQYHPHIGRNYNEIIILFIYSVCQNRNKFDFQPNEIKTWWPITDH